MTVIRSILIAFSMFSALPVPQAEWNEKSMRYALCAFRADACILPPWPPGMRSRLSGSNAIAPGARPKVF